MTRLFRVAIAALLLAIIIAGCSDKPTGPGDSKPVAISASLKQLGIGTTVDRVVLDISGSGFSTIVQELQITNGIVQAEVDVPFGNARVFELSAYSGQSLIYYGADTSDVSTSNVTEVVIYMKPQVPMVKISPLYFSRNGLDPAGEFRVEVYNVDSLFGISFRVDIDSSILQFSSVQFGDLLGPIDSTLTFSQTYPTYVAGALTLRGNQEPMGVSRSGIVATIRYTSKRVGKSAVTLNPDYLRLVDWQGNRLPRQGQLYIENGEVEILAE